MHPVHGLGHQFGRNGRAGILVGIEHEEITHRTRPFTVGRWFCSAAQQCRGGEAVFDSDAKKDEAPEPLIPVRRFI
jgi:hypothetical protein